MRYTQKLLISEAEVGYGGADYVAWRRQHSKEQLLRQFAESDWTTPLEIQVHESHEQRPAFVNGDQTTETEYRFELRTDRDIEPGQPVTGSLAEKVRELCQRAGMASDYMTDDDPSNTCERELHAATAAVLSHLDRLTRDFGPSFLDELNARNEERKQMFVSGELSYGVHSATCDIDALLIFCDELLMRG